VTARQHRRNRVTVRAMQVLHLKRGADRRIRAGHLWIFSNEIARVEGETDGPAGSAAQVLDHKGTYLGCGYYNRRSLIAARLLSRQHEPDETELLRRRILAALSLRERFYGAPDDEGCRLIYGEGDFLPGLVVDSFGDWLVVQLTTAGMDLRRETILAILGEYLTPAGVVLRNDSHFRELEGLDQSVDIVGTAPPSPLELTLEGLRMAVDLEKGQKTGHFYDQSWNRRRFRGMTAGYRVLDTFCYTGAWGLQAAAGRAPEVPFVDSSAGALDLVRRNAALNGLGDDRVQFEKSDVVDFLKAAHGDGRRYDAVVLDPPAFAKTKKAREEALKGYLRLNREGIRCLHPGGLLVTSSCSYHVAPDEFMAVVARAAAQQGRFARVIHVGGQGPDHPVPAGLPEAAYLKCLFVQVD